MGGGSAGSVPEAERSELLSLARRSIRAVLEGGPRPPGEDPEQAGGPRVDGVFVSLHEGDRLRGCVGLLRPGQILGPSVARCAVAAATEDSRFPPLSPDELAACTIEISVLSPPRVLTSPEELRVGAHGLIVSRGSARGLLLPRVPVDHGWSREEFLEQGCRKAGLPPDAWREGARLEVFEAEVFSEEGPPPPP